MSDRKSRWRIAWDAPRSHDGDMVVDQKWFEPQEQHRKDLGEPVPYPLTEEFVLNYGLDLMHSNGRIWVYEERMTDYGEWVDDQLWEEGLHGNWDIGPEKYYSLHKKTDSG